MKKILFALGMFGLMMTSGTSFADPIQGTVTIDPGSSSMGYYFTYSTTDFTGRAYLAPASSAAYAKIKAANGKAVTIDGAQSGNSIMVFDVLSVQN